MSRMEVPGSAEQLSQQLLTLRPAAPEDASAVDQLLQASYPELLAQDYSPETLAKVLPLITKSNPALLASGTFYVVEDAATGKIVGCGGWTRERPGTGAVTEGVVHMRHLATDPRYTRRGVGRMIVEKCFREARVAAGACQFECISTLTAVPFYSTFGFRECERFGLNLPGGVVFDSVSMRTAP